MTDILRATTEGYLAGTAAGKAEAAKYRRGNTRLIECLMDMVNQLSAQPDDMLSLRFRSVGALQTLINAGFAEELEGCTYRLLWDKLEERIQSEIRTHPQAQVPEQRP